MLEASGFLSSTNKAPTDTAHSTPHSRIPPHPLATHPPRFASAIEACAAYGRWPASQSYATLTPIADATSEPFTGMELRLVRDVFVGCSEHRSPLNRSTCGPVSVLLGPEVASRFASCADVEIFVLKSTPKAEDVWKVDSITTTLLVKFVADLPIVPVPPSDDAMQVDESDDDISGGVVVPDFNNLFSASTSATTAHAGHVSTETLDADEPADLGPCSMDGEEDEMLLALERELLGGDEAENDIVRTLLASEFATGDMEDPQHS